MSARKLGLNAVIYGLGGMLNRMISFLLLPLFTHYLSTEDYGRSGLLLILSTFLISVFSVGVGGSLSSCYYRAESEEGRRSAVSGALLLLVCSCAVMLVIFLPFAGWLASTLLDSGVWTNLVILSLTTTALSIVVQPLVLDLQFAGRSKTFVTLSAITTLVTALCNIVAVAWLHLGLYGWMGSQLIGQAISLLLYSAVFLRRGLPRPERTTLRRLLILGLPTIPSFALMFIIQQGNRYAVEFIHGLSSLGIYTVALSLATVSSLAVSSFQTSWTPYFMGFRNNLEQARTAFGRVTTYYAYFMGLVTVCFFAFAQPVVEIMTHEEYHTAWLAVGSAALANVVLGAVALQFPAQYFSEKLGHLTILNAITAVASLGINTGLIAWGGPDAAGFALALSYGFLLALYCWWNHKGFSMRLKVDYEWGRLWTVIAAVALLSSLYLLFPAGSIVSGLLRGVAGPLLFCALVWMLLTPGQRETALGMVRRFLPFRRAPAA